MDPDTYSDQLEPGDSGEPRSGEPDLAVSGADHDYWKRRFFILTGGLALVGGITWALSALLGPARPVDVGARASLAVRNTLPAAAYGAPSGRPRSAAAKPAASATGASPAASTPLSPSPAVSPAPGPSAGKAAAVGNCPPGSIVLSLFTGQARYGPGQWPRFEVYVVSTAPATCRLASWPSVVRVVVTRAGQVIWDSAACKAQPPAAARTVRLAPGVPQVAAITWNRQARAQGCAGSVPAGASGAFSAVAMADGKSSPVRAFTLSRG